MNTRFLHILALLGCLTFLVGNITYDMMATDTYNPNPNIYYLPLSIMVFTLMLLCKDGAKKQGKLIEAGWFFFIVLCAGWIARFIFFNPFIKLTSDYLFLCIALVGSTIKIYRNADRN